MNTISLINRVKYNKYIYTIYYHIGSCLINLLKLFINTDDKLIVFVSFGGRKFDDSPKAIYDAMLVDQRFIHYQLVWAFIHPKQHEITRGRKIKIDTFTYYKTLLRARVWITNSSMTRGLHFTGKNTFELNTWHGSAIKKMGHDISLSNTSFVVRRNKKRNKSIMLAQGSYDVKVFSKAFHRSVDNFKVIGLPRNDVLTNVTPLKQKQIRKKLDLPDGKIIILYAPTFREYDKDANKNCTMTLPINIQKWEKNLGQDFILLFRCHYEVVKNINVVDNKFVRNVSNYPNLNELMIASDVLISDYSSIFFDYSILVKPMLCFTYDYERYEKERGMYFDIREELKPEAFDNEDSLITGLLHIDFEKCQKITTLFRSKYVEKYGNSSQECLDLIISNIVQ